MSSNFLYEACSPQGDKKKLGDFVLIFTFSVWWGEGMMTFDDIAAIICL